MYVPVCAYTRTHSHGAVDQASQPSAGTKLGRKPMSEEEGEGKRSSVWAAWLSPPGCLLLLFQHLKMKHVHLAFKTNGFNKGRAKVG